MPLLYYLKTFPAAVNVILEEMKISMLGPKWMDLKWEPIEDAPVERVEAAGIQFANKLYVIGGYRTLDDVVSVIDVLDLKTGKWEERIKIPMSIPQTHCGIVGENDRYIYFISGQLGIQCSPAVVDAHVFDVETRNWGILPSLPAARYAPITRLWNERIHVMAGSKEDRCTPAQEHWSLGVKDGQATEKTWRTEPMIPLGGPHRSSAVVNGDLYVLGSQHYDRPPIKGDPKYTCDYKSTPDKLLDQCYVLRKGSDRWQQIKNMPFASTHVEYATLTIGDNIIVLGGYTHKMMLLDILQSYNVKTDQWSIVGRLPARNKGLVFGFYDGWLYILTGQSSRSRWDALSDDVLKEGFRTKFSLKG